MAAGMEVPREYVRQQLQSMGIQDISEEDLEAYTRGKGLVLNSAHHPILAPACSADFSRLLHHHLQHDQSATSSVEPSLTETPPGAVPSHRNRRHCVSNGAIFSLSHSTGVPPLYTPQQRPPFVQPQSAVFKVPLIPIVMCRCRMTHPLALHN